MMKNNLVELLNLFDIKNGLASSEVARYDKKINDDYLPYIRPSYRQDTSIDAFVKKVDIPIEYIFPKETLYVSTDGQGSHSYAYVSISEFVPNSNVSVLLPKSPMTLSEKLFYANCITNNRYKFSYGRKPKGDRLKSILIPENPPEYVSNDIIINTKKLLLNNFKFTPSIRKEAKNFDLVKVQDIFNLLNGISSPLVTLYNNKLSDNFIPYLRPSFKQITSISGYVNKIEIDDKYIFPNETLYVSTNGQGSHTYTYVSTTEFVPNSDVTVLIPKQPMSLSEKLYYAQCISINRYKFSYGRKPKGDRLKSILIPETPPSYISDDIINSVLSELESHI